MHVRGLCVTAASTDRRAPVRHRRRRAPAAYVAPGSPCASIYVPAFPRPPPGRRPCVPYELSGEDLWHAADAVRQLVEDDPAALPAVRAVLQPVEDELWAEADDVLEDPAAGADVGCHWGGRALEALRSCIP